jgi:DHA2 family multidrug resistance protein
MAFERLDLDGQLVADGDPAVQQRLSGMVRGLVSHGMNAVTARQQAVAILDRQLGVQASVLAFSRIYLLSGVLLICALPVLLLFKTGRSRASAGLAAH